MALMGVAFAFLKLPTVFSQRIFSIHPQVEKTAIGLLAEHS